MCREHRIAAALGTPVWVGDGKPYDAMVVLDALGEQILMAPKLRLMLPGEPLLFEAGTERRIIPYGDSSLGVVMCREIFDQQETARELGGRARIILWPGSIVRGTVDPTNPEDVTLLAQQLARDQDASVYHSNWAFNIEAPSLPNTGRSFAVSTSGQIAVEAPPQIAGLLLTWETTLAAAWIPEAAL
jgi:predicted amidohydrolase